jgi:hypothetical protein
VQYHWTQYEVIRVFPVPGMDVCYQLMVRDRMSLEFLVWGDWNENGTGRMAPYLEGLRYYQRMV